MALINPLVCKALLNEFSNKFQGKVCHAELERKGKKRINARCNEEAYHHKSNPLNP